MRIGMLGAGRIGAFHAEALTTTPGVDEVVVGDLDGDRAAGLAERLGARDRDGVRGRDRGRGRDGDGARARVRAADSVDAVLAAGVDAVVITTATAAHAALITRAARAGLPAYCEKPIATDLAGTTRALAEVEAAGTLLQMGFQRRFDPGYRAARDAVRAGRLGRLHTVRALTSDPAPPPAGFLPLSGGLVRDCLVHDFDAVRWVTGREISEVYATGANGGADFFREADDVDTAAALLTLDDGTLVTATATRYNGAGYDVRMELAGERDQLVVGLGDRTPFSSAEPGGPASPARPWTGFLDRFADAYRAELAAFVRAARGEAPNPCPGREALHALLVAEACELSRAERRPVPLAEFAEFAAAAAG